LAVLAVVAPYPLAAQLAGLLWGVQVNAMGVWRAAQRLGEAAARYSEQLSQYHADDRSEGAPTQNAPPGGGVECGCLYAGNASAHSSAANPR